jgi:peptide methionine sulfoxide reductase MsrA
MRTIIVENNIYKVSEREFKTIKKLEQHAKDVAADYKQYYEAEDALHEYLDVNVGKYRHIGTVDFHCQR